MRNSLNKVMLIGNVGRDPELRYTPEGIPVATFRVAMSESRRDRDGNLREHTEWHTVVAWRELAERTQRILQKGTLVYVEGRLHTREFEDRDGVRRRVVEIWADSLLVLDRRRREPVSQSGEERGASTELPDDTEAPKMPEDEVPF